MSLVTDKAISMEWEASGTHREITVTPISDGGVVLTVEDASSIAIVELTPERALELAQNLKVTP